MCCGRNVPSTLITKVCGFALRAQAKGLGVPDLRLYVFPQYTPGALSASVEEEKAVTAADEFPRLLEH